MNQQFGTPQVQKEGHGCFFYGCIVLIIVIVLAAAAAGIGGYVLWKKAAAYLDDKPRVITIEQATDQEYQVIAQQLESFLTAAEQGNPAAISLDSHQINTLIARDKRFNSLRGRVYVTVQGDVIRAETSILLKDIGLRMNKYFNGSVAVKIGVAGGVPYLYIVDAEVKGDHLPQQIMQQLSAKNLLMETQPEQRQQIQQAAERIERLNVANGAINIALRAGVPVQPAPAADAKAPAEADQR